MSHYIITGFVSFTIKIYLKKIIYFFNAVLKYLLLRNGLLHLPRSFSMLFLMDMFSEKLPFTQRNF